MSLFKKYKAKKAAKIQAWKSRLDQSQKDAEMELDVATKAMLDCYCAVRDDLCTCGCVHWQKGHVSYFPPWYTNPNGGFYYAVRPLCRLWGNK